MEEDGKKKNHQNLGEKVRGAIVVFRAFIFATGRPVGRDKFTEKRSKFSPAWR